MPCYEKQGVFFVLVAVVLWGLFPVFTKKGLGTVAPPIFAAVTALVASLPLLAIAYARRQIPRRGSGIWKDLIYIGVMGTTIPFLLFYSGTAQTSGITAGLLLQLEPAYSMVLSYFLLREHIPTQQVAGSLMLLAGAMVVIGGGRVTGNGGWDARIDTGELLVMLSSLGYQLAHIRTKRLLRAGADSFMISGVRLGIGGGLLAGVALAMSITGGAKSGLPEVTLATVMGLIGYSFFVVAAEKVLWLEGIRRVNLSKASGFLPISALASLTGGVVILREVPGIHQCAGATLIVAGSLVLSGVPSRTR